VCASVKIRLSVLLEEPNAYAETILRFVTALPDNKPAEE
jgi:hypothetical protein